MSIRFRRGLSINRPSITPQAGEPLYDVDTHKLYVGDGVTAGGVPVDTDGGITTYVRTVNGNDGDVTVNKSTIGLGNVNNTSDANKPVSTAQASALALKADVSSLSSVATSGSYNSLSDKPTIPAAQVQADWGAANGVAHILNKPNLAAVATTGSYNDLTNKPTIPTVPVQSVNGRTGNVTGLAEASDVTAQLNTKVDKVVGKQLSTEDYTTSEKNKLAGIEAGAEVNPDPATLPISTATQTALNGKIDKIMSTYTRAYIASADGSQSSMAIGAAAPTAWSLSQRDGNGRIKVGPPASTDDATTKAYVDARTPIYSTGFPNGVVVATPGRIYIDTAVTNGASSWIKKTGTGNTGWQVLEGDTGRRNVSSYANGTPVFAGGVFVQRTNQMVTLTVNDWELESPDNWNIIINLADIPGFATYKATEFVPLVSDAPKRGNISGAAVRVYDTRTTLLRYQLTVNFPVDAPWPTTLPGTPA